MDKQGSALKGKALQSNAFLDLLTENMFSISMMRLTILITIIAHRPLSTIDSHFPIASTSVSLGEQLEKSGYCYCQFDISSFFE